MRITEAMTDHVRTVPQTMSALDAHSLMKTTKMHHLVVTKAARVVGVISARDISSQGRPPKIPDGVTVEDLMSSPVVTIESGETVRKAANLMQGRTIGCLPVTDHGRLVGIITLSDLLQVLGRGTDRPNHNARPTVSHLVPHKKQHMPTGRW
jgi:CBS domain-containing protein